MKVSVKSMLVVLSMIIFPSISYGNPILAYERYQGQPFPGESYASEITFMEASNHDSNEKYLECVARSQLETMVNSRCSKIQILDFFPYTWSPFVNGDHIILGGNALLTSYTRNAYTGEVMLSTRQSSGHVMLSRTFFCPDNMDLQKTSSTAYCYLRD